MPCVVLLNSSNATVKKGTGAAKNWEPRLLVHAALAPVCAVPTPVHTLKVVIELMNAPPKLLKPAVP
jgi:hypothetical protein